MAVDPLLPLCDFVEQTDLSALPRSVVERVRTVFIDTAGVVVGGSTLPENRAVAERFPATTGGSLRFGASTRHAPQDAAFLNGMAGGSLEFEEGCSPARGHPASQFFAAVAAVAENRRSSGAQVFAALALGYEASARISRAVALRRGLHPSGTWGLVGAALAVGKLCGRRAPELVEVANLAAGFCFSPFVRNSFTGYSAAAAFPGLTNQLAVLANLLFDTGVRADPGSFSATFSKVLSERIDAEALSSRLGDSFAISSGYLKPYPTCRFTHPAVEALEDLLRDHPFTAGEVAGISVTTYDAAAHASPGTPRNAEALRFSTPYLLAARLLHGSLGRDVLRDEALEDPALDALARRVSVTASPELEALRPDLSPARIEATLADGRTLRAEVREAFGDPGRPLSAADVAAKFRSLTVPVVGEEAAAEFLRRAGRAEDLADVTGLFSLLGGPA